MRKMIKQTPIHQNSNNQSLPNKGSIEVHSPTRVDLSGGTLDCWPLYAIMGPCYTLNISVDIYTHVKIVPNISASLIEIDMVDLAYKKTFSNLQELLLCSDKELCLLKSHLEFWSPQVGFYLQTSSESPVGGGLGGSSSLSISLLKAFSIWNDLTFSNHELITLASNIEARFLGTPTGTQDYFSPAQAGLNCIRYDQYGFSVEQIGYDSTFFNQRMSLVYTGRPHHSGINNWEVIKKVVEGEPHAEVRKSLKKIMEVSEEMRDAILNKEWKCLPSLFQREFEARIKLSPGFMSPEIAKLKELAFATGAEAVKICGAGGGGCVMLWSPPEKKKDVENECQERGFQVLPAKVLSII